MPARVERGEIAQIARLGPGFLDPDVLLDQADEIEQPAGGDRVVHEVPARTHPVGGRDLDVEMRDPLDRDQAAIGDAAGEARPLLAEQRMADHRMDAVGADQHVGLDRDAVLEARLDVVAAIGEADAAMREMHALLRQRLGQHGVEIAAVEHVGRRAEQRFGLFDQPRARQRAAVLPAPLVERRRPHADALELLAEPETDQEPRRVRTDHQAGADFGRLRRLLVDVNVVARLQQVERGGEAADAAADHRNGACAHFGGRLCRVALMPRACRAPGRSRRPPRRGRPPGTPPAAA